MKQSEEVADASRRTLRAATTACLVAASSALVAFSLAGHPRIGLALAAGLVIGSVSGPLALRSLDAALPYSIVSTTRIAAQSALAIAAGYLLGTDVIWMPMLGVAAALAILAALAVRGALAAR